MANAYTNSHLRLATHELLARLRAEAGDAGGISVSSGIINALSDEIN